MDTSAYLRRIAYDGPISTNAQTLLALHRAHLFAIPFENLDIRRQREIVLDETHFVPRRRYHQSSPESHFYQRSICSRATPGGRIALADMRLIENDYGRHKEWVLGSEGEYQIALRQHFGLVLD